MKKNYTMMKTLLQKAKRTSLCALAFMATMSINAQNTITWTGTTDTDFLNAANWSTSTAPDGASDVKIAASSNNPVYNTAITGGYISHLDGVSGTTLTVSAALGIYSGSNNYMGGDINVEAGGSMNFRNTLYIGNSAGNPSVINVNGGTFNAKVYMIVSKGSDCTININSGTVSTDNSSSGRSITIGNYTANGVVNLNGGFLKPCSLQSGSAALTIGAKGILNIDGGTLVMGGDQTTFINDYVNAGKIIPASGKHIVATYDSVLNVTNVNAVGPKKIAYLTFDKAMGTGASAVDKDTIIGMFNKDKNFALTVLKDDGNGSSAVDLSQYDLLIVQETFSSSANILKPTGLLGIKNLTIPVIYNKVYALKSGKGNITTTSAAADVTDLAITIPTANKTNPLFTGITFSGDDIAIFNAQAADDGTSPGTKGLQYGSGLELTTTGTCLATLTSQTTSSADTSVIINDIPGGTQFGTATTDVLPATSRMIAFNMNYGAIANANGTNITTNGLKLWQNAAYILLGQIPPATLYTAPLTVKENNIESISVTVSPNPTNGIVNINSPSAISGINVYDISGRKILSANKTNSVNLSGNTSGIYFIQIQTEAGSVTKKVIVK